MKTDQEGRALVESEEGLRLRAYQDSVGVWTIGYGHTSAAGAPKVVAGLTITAAMADQILAADLARFESAVALAVHVPMSQHEFDACVDLCFNIGPGAFAKSSLVRCMNAGDRASAAMAFAMWNKAGGRVLPGLVARRKREATLFRTPDSGAPPLAKPLETSATAASKPAKPALTGGLSSARATTPAPGLLARLHALLSRTRKVPA